MFVFVVSQTESVYPDAAQSLPLNTRDVWKAWRAMYQHSERDKRPDWFKSLGAHATPELFEALSELIEPSALPKWLDTSVEVFLDRKPADLIRSGDTELLWLMIYQLRSGASS